MVPLDIKLYDEYRLSIQYDSICSDLVTVLNAKLLLAVIAHVHAAKYCIVSWR